MSLGLLAYGRPGLLPCTALAAWELIKASGVTVEGATAVVIGPAGAALAAPTGGVGLTAGAASLREATWAASITRSPSRSA